MARLHFKHGSISYSTICDCPRIEQRNQISIHLIVQWQSCPSDSKRSHRRNRRISRINAFGDFSLPFIADYDWFDCKFINCGHNKFEFGVEKVKQKMYSR